MKSNNNKNQGTPQFNQRRNAPEIRDNLDARKNEEQEFKGDDVTHNRKAHHNKEQKKKKHS
jgi:hypothetical protein